MISKQSSFSVPTLSATVARADHSIEAPNGAAIKAAVRDSWNVAQAKEYAELFGFCTSEAGLYGLVSALRNSQIAMGLKGVPFVLRKEEMEQVLEEMADGNTLFEEFFTMKDLEKALEDDFLDAARGSTDNRKGWKVRFRTLVLFDSFTKGFLATTDSLNNCFFAILDFRGIESSWRFL